LTATGSVLAASVSLAGSTVVTFSSDTGAVRFSSSGTTVSGDGVSNSVSLVKLES